MKHTITRWLDGLTYVNQKTRQVWHHQFYENELSASYQVDLQNRPRRRQPLVHICKAKYFSYNSFFNYKAKGSQCWNGIKKMQRNFPDLGACFQVGNEKDARFWLTRWIDDKPLYARSPELFCFGFDPKILVCDVFVKGNTNLAFMRNLTPPELASREACKFTLRVSRCSRTRIRLAWTSRLWVPSRSNHYTPTS